MPYEEVPHTADWALRVWGSDLPTLFAEAARGMYALAGAETLAQPAPATRHAPSAARALKVQGPDAETLLVGFLSELLYAQEQENVLLEVSEIKIQPGETWELQATVYPKPQARLVKAIKAVTFHNLAIRQTAEGYEVVIVFDV